jgi:hypothetical protein
MLRFEPERRIYTDSKSGLWNILKVKCYEKDHFVASGWGKEYKFMFSIRDDVLNLVGSDGCRDEFRRLKDVPAELELAPMPLGPANQLPDEKIKEIQQELSRRKINDQAVRKNLTDTNRFLTESPRVDKENTKYIKSLIGEVGWIDAERFGPEAANAAFLIVQHSGDPRLMMASLPEIEKDVKAKKIDSEAYAMLYDRLELNLGKKQRYGTQAVQYEKGGDLFIPPLVNRRKVEEFRKEIGLVRYTWSQDLERMKKLMGAKNIVFLDDSKTITD